MGLFLALARLGLFVCFLCGLGKGEAKLSVHKLLAEKDRGQYQAISTEHVWSVIYYVAFENIFLERHDGQSLAAR